MPVPVGAPRCPGHVLAGLEDAAEPVGLHVAFEEGTASAGVCTSSLGVLLPPVGFQVQKGLIGCLVGDFLKVGGHPGLTLVGCCWHVTGRLSLSWGSRGGWEHHHRLEASPSSGSIPMEASQSSGSIPVSWKHPSPVGAFLAVGNIPVQWEHPWQLEAFPARGSIPGSWRHTQTDEAMTIAEGHSFHLIGVAAVLALQRAAFARDGVIRCGRCFSGETCL